MKTAVIASCGLLFAVWAGEVQAQSQWQHHKQQLQRADTVRRNDTQNVMRSNNIYRGPSSASSYRNSSTNTYRRR